MEEPSEPNPSPGPPDQPDAAPPVASELPLFPLDLVLFPSMLVPLHIFEERYKEMINRCVRESIPFGIVLATGQHPANGRVETRPVGCTARINRVERLPDGRMNIEVVGEGRFRILDTHEMQPYRTGLVEPLRDAPAEAEAVVPLADDVQRLLKDFLTRSLALVGQRVVEFDLPDEPEQLSYTAACVLPVENDEKQALLEDTDTVARLTSEREVLLREVTRLRRAAEARDESGEASDESASELVSVEGGGLTWDLVKADRLAPYLSAN